MAEVTYNLYKDGEKIASNLEETTYTDTDLTPNSSYSYQVSAENKYGESDLSEPVMVTTDYSAVVSVGLNKETATIQLGETETLTATVSPETAEQDVEWSSDNEEVATVTDGIVTAVSEGEAIITAQSAADNEISDTCTVTVVDDGDAPEEVQGLRSTGKTDDSVTLEWGED